MKQHIWFKVYELTNKYGKEFAEIKFTSRKLDEAWAFAEKLEANGVKCSLCFYVLTPTNELKYEIHRTGN